MKSLAAALVLVGAMHVHAGVLVDTEQPASTPGNFVEVCGPYGEYLCTQSVALQLNFTEQVLVTGLETWLRTQSPGTLTLSFYSDASGLPGDTLVSRALQITDVGQGWAGVAGLSWEFGPGAYWVVVEVAPGQSYYGSLDFPPALRLPTAFMHRHSGGWVDISDWASAGLRVYGEVSAVPEPHAAWLLLAGIPLLAAASRVSGR